MNARTLRGAAAGILVLVVALLPSVAGASPLPDKQAEAVRLQAKIEALGNSETALAEQYNGAVLKRQQVDRQVVDARTQLAEVEARATRARAAMRDVAIRLYKTGPTRAAVPVGGQGTDPARVSFYARMTASRSTDALDGFRATALQLGERRDSLAGVQAQARVATASINQRRQQVLAAQAELTSTLSRVKGDLAKMVAEAEASRQAADAARFRALKSRASRGNSNSNLGPAPATRVSAQAAVSEALRQLGKPYQWGAAGPDSFDCSGLTLWAWRAGGVSLPHYTGAQYSSTTHISLADLAPGDLVYSGDMGHMAMYIGNGNIVESPRTGLNVRVVPMRSEFTLASRP